MKKRIISFLLVLCTLLSLFPVIVASAEETETLIKDEGAGGVASVGEEGGLPLTDYDKLYIGADGGKTANGGSLIGLYTAYDTAKAGITLSADNIDGVWKNKMDASGATDAVLRDSYATKNWELGETGGVGYHMTAAQWQAGVQKMGLTLPAAWAELPCFTVEQAATLDAIDHTDALSYKHSGVRLDLLLGVWLPSVYSLNTNQSYCFRWSYGVTQEWGNTLMGSQEFAHRDAYKANGNSPAGVVTAFTKSTSDAGVTYGVSHNIGGSYSKLCYSSVQDYEAAKATGTNPRPIFSLFNGIPATVYAVRVYDAELTAAEKNYNALIDIMAKAGMDPSSFLALDSASQGMVAGIIAINTMDANKDDLAAELETWIKVLSNRTELSDTLYVTEGLTLFATAYSAMSTGSFESATGMTWLNAIDSAAGVTLKGSGWKANEDNGITIVKTFEEYKKDTTFGMYLPASALPEKDYTVEFVYNPTGVTQTNENGELERYLDTTMANGVYVDDGIIIGPLRCLQFTTYRPAGYNGQLERRWCYHATLPWLSNQVKDYWETTWDSLSLYQVVTYAITHGYNGGAPTYHMYNDQAEVMTMQVKPEEYKTAAEAGNNFRLLMGVAGTAYAVRVYDRVLSAEEMAKNHVADIFYYYELDTALIEECVASMGANGDMVYSAFADMGFDLAKEEAESIFKRKIAAIWMRYEGLGVRKDGKDGIRHYFSISEEAAAAMELAGATVEIGALINVDKSILPTLQGNAYDYKIVGYDSDSGKNAPFFVDEDTFAVTLLYENLDKSISMTAVAVRGYIKLTYEAGTELLYYTDTAGREPFDTTLFGIYDKMSKNDNVKADAITCERLVNATERCYEDVTVYLQAGAAAGGDGSKEKPYHSFADAFAKSKELLAKANAPTNVILLADDGEYGIYETQYLSDSDMVFPYVKLEITSTNGKSILTTTKSIDTAGFTQYANNLWVCQLDKDASGAYPSFRYLYVDGAMAELSYSGGRYSYDEGLYTLDFERDYDGAWGRAYDLYKLGELTADSESGYPEDRLDLIAAFECYKKQFLAQAEMEKQYEAEVLTINSVPADTSDAEYVSYFEKMKLWRLAIDDLKEQNEAKNEGKNYNSALSAFKKFAPSPAYEGNEAFRAEFIRLRDLIVKNSSTSIVISAFEPMVETTALTDGKHYLATELLGDLTASMQAGKQRAEVRYAEVLARYEAADAEGKAAMQEEMDAAAARAGEYTWVRYALEDSGLEMHLAGQWWYNILHIAGVDYDDVVYDSEGNEHVAVYLDLEEYDYYRVHKTYSMKGRYVHVKSALDYVDSEGEYYYEEPTGKLYYYSKEGVSGKEFAHATNDYMFWFDSVRNVTLSNLEITGVDNDNLSENHGCYGLGGVGGANQGTGDYFDESAIRLENCFGLTILNCNFYDLGVRAIFGHGMIENIHIEGNEFTRLGAGAIHFGGAEREREWDYKRCYIEDVVITDNYLYDIAREYYADSAIWLHYGKDVKITFNTIEQCSYTAISVGWTFNTPSWTPGGRYHMYNVEIAYNYLTDFMHETGDGGAIYVTGGNAPKDNTDYFNFIHHNYVLMSNGTGNGLGHMLVGIYFDGSTSNWKCSENVVVEQSYGAVPGEDEGFDLDDEEDAAYLKALRNRFAGTTFIYLQHIVVQITHNILCDSNYILNVRATDPDEQRREVYKNYIVAERNIKEQNTNYCTDINRIPMGAEEIIFGAGCYGHNGDPADLWGNDY